MNHPVDYWDGRWQNGEIQWVKSTLDPYLIDKCSELYGDSPDQKVFIPLCGNTLELKWFMEKGFTVVGVEYSKIPIISLFKDQLQVEPIVEEFSGGSIYRTPDGRLKIYQCNLYDFDVSCEGKFDAFWDVGSLVAINPADRGRYSKLIVSLMKTTSSYVVKILTYDKTMYGGPPCSISESDMEELFGADCTIDKLFTADYLQRAKLYCDTLEYCYCHCLRLKLK